MKRKILYVTAVQAQRDKPALTEATRSVISILARDFEISLADSPAHMVLNLRRILSEAALWQALSERSLQMGSGLLAYHEVAHAVRRYLLRQSAHRVDRR